MRGLWVKGQYGCGGDDVMRPGGGSTQPSQPASTTTHKTRRRTHVEEEAVLVRGGDGEAARLRPGLQHQEILVAKLLQPVRRAQAAGARADHHDALSLLVAAARRCRHGAAAALDLWGGVCVPVVQRGPGVCESIQSRVCELCTSRGWYESWSSASTPAGLRFTDPSSRPPDPKRAGERERRRPARTTVPTAARPRVVPP